MLVESTTLEALSYGTCQQGSALPLPVHFYPLIMGNNHHTYLLTSVLVDLIIIVFR